MDIQRIPVSRINLAPYNPRKKLRPTDPEYRRIKASLDRWNMVEPLVWNRRTGTLVSGHQRLAILKERGETVIDVSVVDLDETEEKALNLALNRVAGDWDTLALADVLLDLQQQGFDTEVAGFTAADFERLTAEIGRPLFTPETAPEIATSTVTDADVAATAGDMAGRHAGARAILDVKCPNCGCEFGVDA